MGIKVNVKTKAKETLKLSNQLRSYLFEQEYEELLGCSPDKIKILKNALEVLQSIIKEKQ